MWVGNAVGDFFGDVGEGEVVEDGPVLTDEGGLLHADAEFAVFTHGAEKAVGVEVGTEVCSFEYDFYS